MAKKKKIRVTENKLPEEQQNENQEDMGIKHNELEKTQIDPSTDHLLPSGQQECHRNAWNGWKCRALASPGNIYCDKHRLDQDKRNEKRRNARQKKGSPFLTDPVLPSGQRQCRRTGRGWRCSQLAPPLKIYCEKHELEQIAHCEKRRNRKRKELGLVGCDETASSSSDCLTVSKRTRKKMEVKSVEYIRVESLDRESGKDVASKESVFPVNEGVVDEHAEKNLSIAQIDSGQLLSVTLEDHQIGSFVDAEASASIMEDNDVTPDNKVIPVDPFISGECTVDNIEQPQSSNEVDDLIDFEFIDNEGVLPLVDIACSSPLQHEEAPILLESGGCNLPDEISKTTDIMLARLNMRLESNESEQNTQSAKRKKYRKRKDQGLNESGETISSNGRYSTVVKRTKHTEEGRRIEHVMVESPKRVCGKDVASEKSLFLVNEGIVDEHADKNLSIAQIDSAQLLSPILEEHKNLSFIHEKASPLMEDNDDNQLKPVSPITTGQSTVESA